MKNIHHPRRGDVFIATRSDVANTIVLHLSATHFIEFRPNGDIIEFANCDVGYYNDEFYLLKRKNVTLRNK